MKIPNRVVGDLGGTNLRIAYTDQTGLLQSIRKISTPADMSMLGQVLHTYITDCEITPDSVVLAVAGPVSKNQAVITNCNQQVIDGSALAEELGVRCHVINDFAAQVYGCATSLSEKVVTIKAGQPRELPTITVVGPGTGLGVGVGLSTSDGTLLYCPSEGGHTELSHPDSLVRERLYVFLQHRLKKPRVSFERVLSGSGIVALYDFFYHIHEEKCPDWRYNLESDTQLCSAIFAKLGEDPGSNFVKDCFLSILGCFAGDLALHPRSDIILVGNILGALQTWLSESEGPFLRAFLNKGVLSSEVAKTSIRGIFDDDLGLFGAANYPT